MYTSEIENHSLGLTISDTVTLCKKSIPVKNFKASNFQEGQWIHFVPIKKYEPVAARVLHIDEEQNQVVVETEGGYILLFASFEEILNLYRQLTGSSKQKVTDWWDREVRFINILQKSHHM